jgi:hypothetical protein
MFEFICAAVLPVIKDLLWAAAGALLTYCMNKLTNSWA